MTPIPGDVVFFDFNGGMLDRAFKEEKGIDALPGVIDLAIFYGRNNLLLNGDVGWVVGNVYAHHRRGSASRWPRPATTSGARAAIGERLVYSRLDGLSAGGVTDVEIVGPELLAQHGIGVVAPFDFALDRELWRWAPDDVSLYMTRLPFVPVPVTIEMASALSDSGPGQPGDQGRAGARTARGGLRLRVGQLRARRCRRGVAGGQHARRGCAGRDDDVRRARSRRCRAARARRISVVTPYIDSVTQRLLDFLGEHGIEVGRRASGSACSSHIWKVGYAEVVQAASHGRPARGGGAVHQLHQRADLRHHRAARTHARQARAHREPGDHVVGAAQRSGSTPSAREQWLARDLAPRRNKTG